MSNKRWEFTGETKIHFGITLKRIRASEEFRLKCGIIISKGKLGGWIEKESNLSGNAWVDGDAMVSGGAMVSGNAWVDGDAMVYGNAWVYGNARVYGDSRVYGDAMVSGDAWVYGNARVYGDAWVFGGARVYGDARVYGNARVHGDARVCGDARVYVDAMVDGNAWVDGNAEIKSSKDYCVYKNTWSSLRWFTYTRSNKMWSVGCFYGTGDELIAKAYKDSEKSGKCYETIVKAQEAIEKAMEV